MLINRPYLPEGMNQTYQRSAAALRAAGDLKKYSGEAIPLEMMVDRCDSAHDLHGTINGLPAVIPRAEAVCSAVSGAEKEIAVLSLVGRPVCCVLLDAAGEDGAALRLSRRAMQEKALAYLEETLREGDVIPAVITSMSPIGVFADIGCGVIALLPIRHISVSRIEHPRERFAPHQRIWAAVQKIDREQALLLLRERTVAVLKTGTYWRRKWPALAVIVLGAGYLTFLYGWVGLVLTAVVVAIVLYGMWRGSDSVLDRMCGTFIWQFGPEEILLSDGRGGSWQVPYAGTLLETPHAWVLCGPGGVAAYSFARAAFENEAEQQAFLDMLNARLGA